MISRSQRETEAAILAATASRKPRSQLLWPLRAWRQTVYPYPPACARPARQERDDWDEAFTLSMARIFHPVVSQAERR